MLDGFAWRPGDLVQVYYREDADSPPKKTCWFNARIETCKADGDYKIKYLPSNHFEDDVAAERIVARDGDRDAAEAAAFEAMFPDDDADDADDDDAAAASPANTPPPPARVAPLPDPAMVGGGGGGGSAAKRARVPTNFFGRKGVAPQAAARLSSDDDGTDTDSEDEWARAVDYEISDDSSGGEEDYSGSTAGAGAATSPSPKKAKKAKRDGKAKAAPKSPSVFADAAAAAAKAAQSRVGRRVRKFWDEEPYMGTVTEYDAASGLYM